MNDGEGREAVFYTRVQARGGCLAGDERSHAGGDCERVGDHADDAAALATRHRCWRGEDGAQPPTPIMASPADQASEIAKLRRELDRTRMERDILKKAVGIFAEMPR